MNGFMCLSDEMFKLWQNFKEGRVCNSNVYSLLNYLRLPFLTNRSQLTRLGIVEQSLLQSYQSLFQQKPHLQNSNLEQLCQETLYKIILSDKNGQLPYVNIMINNCFIQNTFSISVVKHQNRDNIKNYLKQLLEKAKELYIFDYYLADRWYLTKELFSYLKSNNVTINLLDKHLNKQTSLCKTTQPNGLILSKAIENDFPQCHVVDSSSHPYFINKKHDRFIIIDNEIELIFSSGLDNFFSPNHNECTLVIRKII